MRRFTTCIAGLLVLLSSRAVTSPDTFVAGMQPPHAWEGRRIYQLLTDRFAVAPTGRRGQESHNNDNATDPNPPCDYNLYCGGTFNGITQQLDYIVGMGFNAIWISPVPVNYHEGYHGYWATDFTQINPHFGTNSDLQNFVQTAHSRGVWVMVDVVLNHVGPVGTDFSQVVPFNSPSHYHAPCQVTQYQCESYQVQHCRLCDLPDLDQDVPFVQDKLVEYVQWLLKEFQFDGIRADTVMYIKNSFWTNVTQTTGTYIVGEVWADLSCNVNYARNGVSSTLNYELFYTIRNVFQQGQSMYQLGQTWRDVLTYPHSRWEANFVDNHDNDRFLNQTYNIPAYKSALTHVLFTQGIPIIYYGTEQLFSGGIDGNYCREALWPTNYNTNTDMYRFLQTLNAAHEQLQVSQYDAREVWQDDTIYCFVRGKLLVCTTNGASSQTRNIPNLPFAGKQVCDWFQPSSCQTGAAQMAITIPQGGLPLLLLASG